MDKKSIQKLFRRLFLFTLIGVILIISSIVLAIEYEPKVIYSNGDWNYQYLPNDYNASKWNIYADFHSHTLYSDGKLTVEQNLQWHISNGYNVVAISDHNTWDHIPEVMAVAKNYSNLIVFPASEWTTNIIHMNIVLPIGTTGYETLVPPKDPDYSDIQEAINKTHDLGGIVIINHFNWSLERMPDHPSRENVYEWGADYIEIVNSAIIHEAGGTFDQASFDFVNSKGDEMGGVGSTDMHTPRGSHAWTGYWANNFTNISVWNQIMSHNSSVLYQEDPTPYKAVHPVTKDPDALKPLILLGRLFQNFDLGGGNYDYPGIGYVLMNFYGIFLISEILRVVDKKVWKFIGEKFGKKKGHEEEYMR